MTRPRSRQISWIPFGPQLRRLSRPETQDVGLLGRFAAFAAVTALVWALWKLATLIDGCVVISPSERQVRRLERDRSSAARANLYERDPHGRPVLRARNSGVRWQEYRDLPLSLCEKIK